MVGKIVRKVRDGSGDSPGDPVKVSGPSRWSGTGRGNHREIRDVSVDPQGGPEWVGRPGGRSATGRRKLGDPGRVGGTARRSGTGCETV